MNFDQAAPNSTTVTIRECKGFRKRFCNYAQAGKNAQMIWPFVQTDLTGNTKLNFYGPGIYHEARCLDENEFYGRSELYPGWNCLIDLDCHSNKCVKSKCVGKKLNESC